MRTRRESQAVIKGPEGYLAVRKLNGEWRLLKGGIEDGETPEQALKREIREEVNINDIEIIEQSFEYNFEVDDIKHVVHSFLVETEETTATIEEKELQDFEWVETVEGLKDKVTFDNERKAIEKAVE